MCFIYSLLIKHWDFSDDFVQVNGKRITTVVTNYRLSYVKQLWDKNIEKQWNMKCDLINLCLFISNQVFFAVSRNEKLSISLVGNFDICMIMGKFCGANFLKFFLVIIGINEILSISETPLFQWVDLSLAQDSYTSSSKC